MTLIEQIAQAQFDAYLNANDSAKWQQHWRTALQLREGISVDESIAADELTAALKQRWSDGN
jgi:hypothetical protein